jgi:Cu2+-exporting ATPase
VDTVVFDKTGTLTAGTPELCNADEIPTEAFRLAMGLARGSAHPLSRAILAAGAARGLEPLPVQDLREVPGHGAEGRWQGQRLRLGRAAWLGAAPGAQTSAWLAVGSAAPLAFRFTDRLRPGAAEAVTALREAGLRVLLLSGDTPAAVADLAQRLAIPDWQAEALPQDKLARIEALRAAGARVLMVGDGLNDTAALAAAHVSISPASALDAARAASDIVLLGQSLAPIPAALVTARQAVRRIRENFTIASGYNVIAVPLAVAGLCSPLIAALAMSTSSITVSLNALRLR